VNGLYGATLAVLNIGDIFTTGPEEAAFAVLNMIRPIAVIPSHANELATTGGVVNADSRTARFIDLISPGVPPFNDARDSFYLKEGFQCTSLSAASRCSLTATPAVLPAAAKTYPFPRVEDEGVSLLPDEGCPM